MGRNSKSKGWMIGWKRILILASLGTIFGAEDVAKRHGKDNLEMKPLTKKWASI